MIIVLSFTAFLLLVALAIFLVALGLFFLNSVISTLASLLVTCILDLAFFDTSISMLVPLYVTLVLVPLNKVLAICSALAS